jgi:spore coat protein U-like protein
MRLGRHSAANRGMAGAVLGLALAIALPSVPGRAIAAADSHTLAVAATVLSRNKCRFTAPGPTALSFGAIDPSVAAPATASAVLSIRCTGSDRNVVYQLAGDGGLNGAAGQPRMRHASDPARYLPYQLNIPQSGTAARNALSNVTVNGNISPADFVNALAGDYADTVTLTILP